MKTLGAQAQQVEEETPGYCYCGMMHAERCRMKTSSLEEAGLSQEVVDPVVRVGWSGGVLTRWHIGCSFLAEMWVMECPDQSLHQVFSSCH